MATSNVWNFIADKSGELKKCGVTKTISPPTIKQEPLDDPNQSMVPDSSSDLHSNPRQTVRKTTSYSHHRVKTEFEVKQEPNWDGEVAIRFKFNTNISLVMIQITDDVRSCLDEVGRFSRPLLLLKPRGTWETQQRQVRQTQAGQRRAASHRRGGYPQRHRVTGIPQWQPPAAGAERGGRDWQAELADGRRQQLCPVPVTRSDHRPPDSRLHHRPVLRVPGPGRGGAQSHVWLLQLSTLLLWRTLHPVPHGKRSSHPVPLLLQHVPQPTWRPLLIPPIRRLPALPNLPQATQKESEIT